MKVEIQNGGNLYCRNAQPTAVKGIFAAVILYFKMHVMAAVH